MQKNLVLAIGLSMAVYGLWLLWMARHAPAPVPPGQTPTLQGPATRPSAPAPPGAGKRATTYYPWQPDGAQMRFAQAGGALAGLVIGDVSGPLDLLPKEGSRYFATWPDVDFRPIAVTAERFLMEGRHPSGLLLRKEFVWRGAKGPHMLRIAVTNPTPKSIRLEDWSLDLGPGLGTVASELSDNYSQLRAIASYQEPPRRSPTVEKLKPMRHARAWNWVGIDNRYFLAALLLRSEDFPAVEVREHRQDKHVLPVVEALAAPADVGPGASRTWELRFYLGPKDYIALKEMSLGLDASVDFGLFGFLGKAAFRVLRGLYGWTGNYGVAIILLTVLLQTLLMPLTLKSLATSLKMQKLQPKIQEIQRRFKDDPQRMNVEMMELYKASGTNPLGGCLPILAQLPILWALFTMLRNCWELHGAPFGLWIRDLSAHDPYYVLPILMGLVMLFQQRLNPPAGDPAQQKIFMFMPLLFTIMFMNFPAGLVLYWMVSSLFGLAQQVVFKRYAKP